MALRGELGRSGSGQTEESSQPGVDPFTVEPVRNGE